MSQETSDADVEDLARLFVEFKSSGSSQSTLEEGREVMKESVRSRHVWTWKLRDHIAGYILVGRFTPRTVAIRNVYVSTSSRRQGVAEAMVRAVTRYYLGATPLGFNGGPDSGPTGGIKQEICLNVASDEAERLYKRTGFLFNARDPVSGVVAWYPSCWRGVESTVDA